MGSSLRPARVRLRKRSSTGVALLHESGRQSRRVVLPVSLRLRESRDVFSQTGAEHGASSSWSSYLPKWIIRITSRVLDHRDKHVLGSGTRWLMLYLRLCF